MSKGYSQEYVADEIGVSLSSYQRYETLNSNISVQLLVKLAELYGLTLDEIYTHGEKRFDVVQDGAELYFREQRRVDVMVRLDGSQATLDSWVKKLSAINAIL